MKMPNSNSTRLLVGIFWVCAGSFLQPTVLQAQVRPSFYDYVRGDLHWYTIETEHFLVHFHADDKGQGSSRTARVVARVAEDIYGPITELYGYEPDSKVSFILKDFEDYSNGAAYFFDNMIEIWAPSLNTPYRGDHNWLRNVITHEFTHMVQVQKSMKGSRKVPFYYLQVLDYEDVRRPDVLYGFPNVIATYPIPILNNPAWLAEGTAQFQRSWMDNDRWDSHRDMLLRTRILAGKELSLADMGGFYSHTSLLRESVYNHGFAFTQYLVDRFGEDGLRVLSEQLGNWSNWTFEQAAKDGFGIPGDRIYRDWIDTLRVSYRAGTAAIRKREISGATLVDEGFNNFYPRFAPDGAHVAYLSNQGQDFSRTGLYLLDISSGTSAELDLPGGGLAQGLSYTCSLGHVLRPRASGPIAWHPDGESIVYAYAEDTPEGYLYADIYSFNLESRSVRRLTEHERASAPAWSPDGSKIVFVREKDGTTNLVLLEPASGNHRAITNFEDGSQVTEPVFDPSGSWIYFAFSRGQGRDIYRIAVAGGEAEAVLDSRTDERSPAFSGTGEELYFASDRSGVFNLYRTSPDNGWSAAEQLTNELGGAFMPSVSRDGTIVYSRYDWDGYHIARIEHPESIPKDVAGLAYVPPKLLFKARTIETPRTQDIDRRAAGDARIKPVPPQTLAGVDLGEAVDAGNDTPGTLRRYSNVFTSFSFLPILRLDQYVSRRRDRTDVRLPDRTRLNTLWRNTKVGMFTASREVLNGLSMFAGLLIGPGSRPYESFGDYISPSNLLKLERDLFIQFEYRKGLGIIPRRWSPQFSLELFNIRRNVESGLAIEEFPCTACFPDTTLADISYNLWELNLSARSKVNRSLLIETGFRISPYRVTTERFFSKELQQTIPESSSRYFIGRSGRLKLYYEALHPYRNADVVPSGIRADALFERETGKLLSEFSLEDGFLKPVYERSTINRVTIDARYGLRLRGFSGSGAHGIGIRMRWSSILGRAVDDFYDDYVGGLTGARGYPFYALGGNETLWTQVSYTFPLFPKIRKQFLFTYVDKIYVRLYGDGALAWTGAWPGLDNLRKDAGMELRFGLGSYYLFPTAVFVSTTYGFNSFDFQLDQGFVTPDGQNSIRYGRNLQWHVGVMFGFDQF